MGEENITNLSKSQKDVIYKEMLEPLKLKIVQILLYDTNAALQFLQEYNKIIENEEQSCNALIQSIVELETNISKYEKTEGKEKRFKAQSKAILHSIEDLMRNSSRLGIEEFEGKFVSLKSNYDQERANYSFEDRNEIERKLYELQSSLIMRQVASGKTNKELQQIITEQDKDGLNIFVIEWVNKLREKDGLKDVADSINSILIADNDAVLNPELWNLINLSKGGENSQKQLRIAKPTDSISMTIAPKNKSNTLK